jgi:hypothetical protein
MIRIAVRSDPALRSLEHIARQLPFAVSKALNDLGIEFQRVERAHLGRAFTLRRRDWAEKNVKITHFAKKTDLHTTIAIESPGDPSRSDILSKFESDTQKRPKDGKSIALPVDAKRSKADIVRKAERPRAFNFRLEGNRTVGDRRTFILPIRSQPGARGIFQRVGKGRGSRIRLLFFLKPGAVPIDPDLDFYENAMTTINNQWREKFDSRLREALATAR